MHLECPLCGYGHVRVTATCQLELDETETMQVFNDWDVEDNATATCTKCSCSQPLKLFRVEDEPVPPPHPPLPGCLTPVPDQELTYDLDGFIALRTKDRRLIVTRLAGGNMSIEATDTTGRSFFSMEL